MYNVVIILEWGTVQLQGRFPYMYINKEPITMIDRTEVRSKF